MSLHTLTKSEVVNCCMLGPLGSYKAGDATPFAWLLQPRGETFPALRGPGWLITSKSSSYPSLPSIVLLAFRITRKWNIVYFILLFLNDTL